MSGKDVTNGNGAGRRGAEAFELKIGLAEMMKNGVIMDVTDAEQATLAEDSGARAGIARDAGGGVAGADPLADSAAQAGHAHGDARTEAGTERETRVSLLRETHCRQQDGDQRPEEQRT